MVYQILLDPNVAGKQVRKEQLREGPLIVENAYGSRFLQLRDRAIRHCDSGRHSQLLSRQAALAKESSVCQYRDDCLFALFGYDGQLDLPLLEIEQGISRIGLRENDLFVTIEENLLPLAGFG